MVTKTVRIDSLVEKEVREKYPGLTFNQAIGMLLADKVIVARERVPGYNTKEKLS